MKKQALILPLLGVSLGLASVSAGAEDFTLRRLPASMGDQFVNGNGQHRVFIPVAISDNGIVVGQRWTWTQDTNGNIITLDNQASYLYDLNTRQYVAQFVKNMVLTSITDDYYFGKRIDSAHINWDTYRCPISGLVQDPVSGDYTNPACVLVDRDVIGPSSETSGPNVSGGYMLANILFRPIADATTGTSPTGSTVVYRFTHPESATEGDVFYYYRVNYPVIKTDAGDQDISAFLTSLLGYSATENSLLVLTEIEGKDDFVFYHAPEFDGGSVVTPGKLTEVRYPVDGVMPNVPVFIQHDTNWIGVSNEQQNPFMVNYALDILTASGICNLADISSGGCSQVLPIDYTLLTQTTDVGSSVLGFDRHHVIMACLNSPSVDGGNPGCTGRLFIYGIENDAIIDLGDKVAQKFSETVAPADMVYTLPGWEYPTSGARPETVIPEKVVLSANQKYLVWVVKRANGNIARYSVVFD